MSFVIDAFDESKQEGTWLTLEGSKFLIAWAQNPNFQREYKRLTQSYKDVTKLSSTAQKELTCEALSKTILLDWKDVNMSDGTSVPYSQETAKAALMQNPELLEWVTSNSVELDNFRKDSIKDTVKK